MLRVTKCFTFDAAHRLFHHEGTCRNLHGHTYRAVVTIEGPACAPSFMVIDFGKLKTSVGAWIDRTWDHATLLNKRDPLVQVFLDSFPAMRLSILEKEPTAEYMCTVLFGVVEDMLKDYPSTTVYSVRIFETPTSFAEYFGVRG